MTAHRHEHRQQRGHQQPPFFAAAVQAQAQHKQENGYGAHVHRTGSKRLRPPVQRQLFGGLFEVLLPRPAQELDGLGFFRIHRPGRCPSVKVRNHQVGQFLPAVAPRGGIVQVQAAGIGPFFGKFRPAAHGLRRVFGQRQQFIHVGGDTRASQHQQQG